MIVALEGNFDDREADLQNLLRRMAELHVMSSTRRWQLRLGECQYLGPWASSVIAAAFKSGELKGQRPRVTLPNRPPELAAYCNFCGLANLVGRGDPPDAGHPRNQTVPLTFFREANWHCAYPVLTLVKRHVELATEQEERLHTCIFEVVQNVVDHARSDIGGVLTARYIESRQEVRVAVVDRGVGIAESLRGAGVRIDDEPDALRRIIAGGHSAKSRPNNMGQGVSNLFSLIRQAGGRILLISGLARAAGSSDAESAMVSSLDFRFPGTGVFFVIPASSP